MYSLRRVQRVQLHQWSSRSKQRNKSQFALLVRKHPVLLFGLPFCLLMISGSFILSEFTQTRYELRERTMKKVDEETKLRLEHNRKPLSLQEEYWRLSKEADEDDHWEIKRIERPEEINK
jgi:cytochrome c oxidase assembly protein subunit 16